jgi:hypothetical protein
MKIIVKMTNVFSSLNFVWPRNSFSKSPLQIPKKLPTLALHFQNKTNVPKPITEFSRQYAYLYGPRADFSGLSVQAGG